MKNVKVVIHRDKRKISGQFTSFFYPTKTEAQQKPMSFKTVITSEKIGKL